MQKKTPATFGTNYVKINPALEAGQRREKLIISVLCLFHAVPPQPPKQYLLSYASCNELVWTWNYDFEVKPLEGAHSAVLKNKQEYSKGQSWYFLSK